uniref:HDC02634 n=1 Tax=Drosophila melanogaster TaxID=7227 RepID=Q6IHG1_DROME|nr:TPA_inf: HDC02634 [Drosophila melanogaster]
MKIDTKPIRSTAPAAHAQGVEYRSGLLWVFGQFLCHYRSRLGGFPVRTSEPQSLALQFGGNLRHLFKVTVAAVGSLFAGGMQICQQIGGD